MGPQEPADTGCDVSSNSIIRSDHRGTGLGDVLLDWSSYRTEMAGGLWLRLDCWRDNTGLHKYYLERGFQYLTTRTRPVSMSGALFERPAELRLGAGLPAKLIDHTLGGEPFPPTSGVPASGAAS